MVASSSGNLRFDVFPSFNGEDVRNSFLSHLRKELNRKSINIFMDHEIERSRQIGDELFLAIKESRISIVIFSKNYASSTWCLNELVEIHKCCMDMELKQMVIPIFYKVDPSEVRHQTGKFGKVFGNTCNGKQEYEKTKWMKALTFVATLAGEHLGKGTNEADMVEKIANDVSNKLTTPLNCFEGLVGIEGHIKAMYSRLCLESEEVRTMGIVGPSGIGKSTIGLALFTQLSSQFPNRIFATFRRTSLDKCDMKLSWEQQFLSKILGQKDIEICDIPRVKGRLKHKKVLIVLDDVDDLELLKTLVGKTEWFGRGSRIIVITQDNHLLKAHKIKLIYEVKPPSEDLALEMLCQSAFEQKSPPEGFRELAVEVAKFASNLPLALSVLGSSLKERDKEEWMKMLPKLKTDLHRDIGATLRVGYERLHEDYQVLFLYVAFLFNGAEISCIQNLLGDSVDIGLTLLAEKSLIRITPDKTVEMHHLLEILSREIVRAESIDDPGKRRFLFDIGDIRRVLTENTGTENVLGLSLNISDIKGEPISVHKKSFKSMRNLQILRLCYHWYNHCEGRLNLPQGFVPLLRNWLDKFLAYKFEGKYFVTFVIRDTKHAKLWEETLPLENLRLMNKHGSKYLEELPDLSKTIILEEIDLSVYKPLVEFPYSVQNVSKLWKLFPYGCGKLKNSSTLFNVISLRFYSLYRCSRSRTFPNICMDRSEHKLEIVVEDCLRSKNMSELFFLDCLLRCKSNPLLDSGNLIEILDFSMGSLVALYLEECSKLREIPDLDGSNLERLGLLSFTSGNFLSSFTSLEIVDFSD